VARPFGGDHVAKFVRDDAAAAVQEALGELGDPSNLDEFRRRLRS
jgi:hypothetical protein